MHVHSSLTATSAAAKEAKEAPLHEPLVAKVAILLADGALAILVAAGEDEPTLAHEVDHIVLCWLAFVEKQWAVLTHRLHLGRHTAHDSA